MNTPTIKTERLILRKFTNKDLDAIFLIFSDEEVNRFLPWFPLKSMEDAKTFYEEHFLNGYLAEKGYIYAVCLKTDNIPVGYVNVEPEDSYIATNWDMAYVRNFGIRALQQRLAMQFLTN